MAYLWTPAPVAFDRDEAIATSKSYNARIIRDQFGVPHIYGKRNADVGFGLAYAHAEDDWATIEEVVSFSRGTQGLRQGKSGAITDYLIHALGVWPTIADKYNSDLSADTRSLVEGYAAGINLWCAEDKKRCARGIAPVSSHDIVAGFVARTPFFYGLNTHLTALFEGNEAFVEEARDARRAFLHTTDKIELGSNAFAVSPQRSSDGHTRLIINSHQPYTGPVAWYEARVKSEEGWDMIGGLFPGAPLILLGTQPERGWALTVNKPDLVDIYALDVDRKKKPRKYKFDGAWRDFEQSTAKFRVKLFGRLSIPVTRPTLRSVHGPVFETPNGYFAVSFGGDRNIQAIEQWWRMNKAKSYQEWRNAMSLQGIPSFNVVYADHKGRIGYFYNAALPKRNPIWDWKKIAPGHRQDLVWSGRLPFGSAPIILNPTSGVVMNANNSPFEASLGSDNLDAVDFPEYLGIDTRSSNRGIRLAELFEQDNEISEADLLSIKFDTAYAKKSVLRQFIETVITSPIVLENEDYADVVSVLEAWDGETNRENRGAALATMLGQQVLGAQLNNEDPFRPDLEEALEYTVARLLAGFGRIDPEWGEVSQLHRGKLRLPLDGGPDTIRAIYADGDVEQGGIPAIAGDSYYMYVDWPPEGPAKISTIHQYGAATLDETSPHYADQAILFSKKKFKTPPMTLEALELQMTREYIVGGAQ